LLVIGIKSGIPTRLGCLLQHVQDEGVQGELESLIWAVAGCVEIGLEAFISKNYYMRPARLVHQTLGTLQTLTATLDATPV
jgi:hypothetical protein